MEIQIFTNERIVFLIEASVITEDFFVIHNPSSQQMINCLSAVKVMHNNKEYLIQTTDAWIEDNTVILYLYINKA